MSHIAVKKIIFERTEYAGRKWFFGFSEMPQEFAESNVEKYIGKLQNDTTRLAKNWDTKLNTEWLVRHYLSVKMLFTASLMLTSANYAHDKNVRVTDSYLQYYALFSCLRAILFSDPRSNYGDGSIFGATHTKTINKSINVVSAFSKKYGKLIKSYVNELKDLREIYSYGAPSSGPSLCEHITRVDIVTTINICKLLSEVAQMQSEVLEMSIDKHFKGQFLLSPESVGKCFEYFVSGESIIDEEDMYRIGYYFRKWPRPTNLLCMVSEGHVEDYFGAWCSNNENEDSDVYDPDEDWRIIFPFP